MSIHVIQDMSMQEHRCIGGYARTLKHFKTHAHAQELEGDVMMC